MIYVTDKTKKITLSSVAILLLTFTMYPSIITAVLPSAIILFLMITLITFKPKISVTSYIIPETINFKEYAEIYVKIKSSKRIYVEVYDELPKTVEVVGGKPCYKGVINEGEHIEFKYLITPLTPGIHDWRVLRIHVRDCLNLFEIVLTYDIHRRLIVKTPKTYTKPLYGALRYRTLGFKEHYEPLFDKVRPYSPGNSLKQVIPRSILIPGGLRVKSFAEETYGRKLKLQEIRIIPVFSRDLALKFQRTYSLLLHIIYSLYMEGLIRGYPVNIVVPGGLRPITSFNDINRSLEELRKCSEEEIVNVLRKHIEGVVVVDYISFTRFYDVIRRTEAYVLIIMPIPNYYELLIEMPGIRTLLNEISKENMRKIYTVRAKEKVYIISHSTDLNSFIRECL